MKMNNLKIGTQTTIGTVFVLLLMISFGMAFWYQANRIVQLTVEMYDHPLTVKGVISVLKADVLTIEIGMNRLANTGDQTAFAEIAKRLDVCEDHASRQFDALFSRYLGPQHDVEKAYALFSAWRSARREAVHTFRNALLNGTPLQHGVSSGWGDSSEMLNVLGKINGFADKKSRSFYQQSRTIREQLDVQLVCWVAVGGFLILVLVFFFVKNIRRPLAELNTVAELFREGNTNVRCKYVSNNELGLLSATFNKLADTLEAELKLGAKATKLSRMMLEEEDAHRFCRNVLGALVEDTWSQMGAIYLLNEESSRFECFESVGMMTAACKPFSAKKMEGEFGKALLTGKIQHITKIPSDSRFTFATVMGEFLSREVITIPIVAGNKAVAVVSLASIKSYSPGSLRLIHSIIETLNARMNGILAHRKILEFSQKLEFQNMELESQKNELTAQASELSEQNSELEMQKKQLSESNKLKSSFLSNMSHELRTPLNSVIALSGVLIRRLLGKIPEEEFGYLSVIERNGRNLLVLINEILDLSRIESGREELEIGVFNLNSLIDDVVQMVEPQAVQKNIVLRFVPDSNLPEVESDSEKCRHILQNIVANAVKFTEEGCVEVSTSINDAQVCVSVEDTGIGIEKDYISAIFDEFRQADGSNSRKYGGTGLGLAIARKYAEILGGNIEVSSTPGVGSCFVFILPLRYNEQGAVTVDESSDLAANTTETYVDPARFKEKTLLLVEDTDAAVVQMKDILETQGYRLKVARNGKEALEVIDLEVPDGLILDLMMPGMDGFEVLRRIREQNRTDRLPVIVLTAKYITKEELSFLERNSIYQIIHKGDVNKDHLLEAVANMVFQDERMSVERNNLKRVPLSVSGVPVVLVVEDNPDNMLTIRAMLSEACEVVEAKDGVSGLQLAGEHHPQLIFMDIALPDLNGREVLNELRNDPTLKGIPVVAVSASAMKGDREAFLAFGFDDYISKPIDNQKLTEIVDKWIKR